MQTTVKKLQYVLRQLTLVLIVVCSVSCVRWEIYYTPSIYEIHIIPEQCCEYEVDDEFRYFWTDADIEDGGWGRIGYGDIGNVYEDVILDHGLVATKLAHEDPVLVSTSNILDVMITNYNLCESDHSYIVETDTVPGKVFSFLENYPIHKQPGEIWASTIKDEPCKISGYEWDLIEEGGEYYDGQPYYQRKIFTELQPQSFIYLIQICIENDDDEHWAEMRCDSLVMSGVSSTRDIWNKKSTDDKCNIIGELKPAQVGRYTDDGNGSVKVEEYLFASRIVSFGIPSAYQQGSSWNTSDANRAYLGFKIILSNGVERRVRIDISTRMKDLTMGGLINVQLKYSEVWIESQNTGGGFDVGVGDWNNDSIYIRI